MDLSIDWALFPSVMIQALRPAPVQVDFNLALDWKEIITVGLSYRNKDALILTSEFDINEFLEIGYAFDLTVSELQNYNQGTHEVIIGYRFGGHHKKILCPAKFW
jgi:type IX secretion system PorP/SprF family membrane protein